jgi:hypothetical protein
MRCASTGLPRIPGQPKQAVRLTADEAKPSLLSGAGIPCTRLTHHASANGTSTPCRHKYIVHKKIYISSQQPSARQPKMPGISSPTQHWRAGWRLPRVQNNRGLSTGARRSLGPFHRCAPLPASTTVLVEIWPADAYSSHHLNRPVQLRARQRGPLM